MQPMRSNRQIAERLDYIGSMVRELARMANDDNHALLTYILNTALFEIEEQKSLRTQSSANPTVSEHERDNAA
jgi:hypothetical protein